MNRVHLMLTALLPILWCFSSVIALDTCLQTSPAAKPKSETGFVNLKVDSNKTEIEKLDGLSLLLNCSGYAFPHGKIIWYRYKNESGCLKPAPIHEYWSFDYHYIIQSNVGEEGRVESSLTIDRFSKFYEGLYFCMLINGDYSAFDQREVELTHVPPPDPRPSEPPPGPYTLKLDFRLMLNISVELVNNSVLISWERTQRNEERDFCRGKYKWGVQVLTWKHDSELHKDYSHIWNQSFVDDATKVQSTFEIPTADCYKNRTFLNINVSNSVFYKFQIKVNKTVKKETETVLGTDFYGSYLHYFGSKSLPSISYPREGQVIPAGDSPCVVTGEPEPLLQVLRGIDDHSAFTCIASSVHVNAPHMAVRPSVFVSYRVEEPEVISNPPMPESRCEPSSLLHGVCSQYIPRDIFVNITSNISDLEEEASVMFAEIVDSNDNCQSLMREFVCHSLFPHCPSEGMRRSICRQSCMEAMQCGGRTFQNIQSQLPPGSDASGNCFNLVDTEAGDAPECILLTSQKDGENFTDGSCLVGKGQNYTGPINVTASGRSCRSWSQQDFYHPFIFPELWNATASCRNPGGAGKRPWCYVNLTDNAPVRWEYCDIPQCPSCEPVPDECRNVQGYSRSTSVFIGNNGRQQQSDALDDCTPDSTTTACYDIWKNIACHLAFPNCVESTSINQMHSARPLCKAYCERIKKVTNDEGSCPMPHDCDMSSLVHQLPENCSGLPKENCITAELILPSTTDGELVTTDNGDDKQVHLALSIFVAAAVCLVSVLTIAGIIIGYCCCCYCGVEPNRNALIKPIPNPLENPVFATMKFKYVSNPDYSKSSFESTSAFADKSLRPISKTQIHYIRDLGSGNFGLVYQGKVEKIIEGEEFTMAAIKTLREGSSAEGMKNFLHEAKLACQFDHDNIIKLHGICMSEGFYCLVFEYMDLGDLNEYLRGSASSTQRHIMNPLDSTSRSRTESSLSNNPPRLNVQQLVSICHQIALGMEYFASLNHVHRDLATRNCLVATGLVVKIGDFGMSQTLYHSDYYKQRGEQALPVRWMAPEAFIYGRFSSEGDVWSFGVVMWEVFSFAMQPYYGKMNDQVMNEVRRGHTLSHPDDCPSTIYEIMRSCWQMEPHRRPTFRELVDELNTWRPTHCSTSTALESQGSLRDDIEDSVSLPSIQDKDVDLELSVFDDCNMSGTEEDIAD